jgi:cytochrome P450
MDPPEHTLFREINERYFTLERMAAFEPAVRAISRELVAGLPRGGVELMAGLAEAFANHIQCSFMGWPDSLREPLRLWTQKNHEATLTLDRAAMSAVAVEFDSYIREQLRVRREAGAGAPDDNTTRLLAETVDGRAMTDAEIVSTVRNWTVGELGTIAASVGIIVHYLAAHSDVQQQLREHPEAIEHATDEILRMHAPLIANRRRTTTPVTIAGRDIPGGERVMVLWASANRDEDVFGDPDEFRLDRDPADNLLYGRGIHACPGAPLARLELRVLLEELLAATTAIETVPGKDPAHAAYPGGGYTILPLMVR